MFYEHGRTGSCHSNADIGNQCEHFHLNILASDVCIHDELQKGYGSGMIINRLYEVSEFFNEWGEYLCFESSIGEARYYSVQNKTTPPGPRGK